MTLIPIYLNFDHSKPLGHVAMGLDSYTLHDYVLAVGGREVTETKAGLPIDGEVLEFGLIPDSNYRAYLDDIKPLKWSRRPALPAVDPQENKQGLYPDEQSIMDNLMAAYEAFKKLDRHHPDELREFVDGIHLCQNILGMRVLRRAVPTGWPTYQREEKTVISEVAAHRSSPIENTPSLFVTAIQFSGPKKVACDRNCDKAWGINTRPSEKLSDDPDDRVWLADSELGLAPENPGTSEGGDLKLYKPDHHNKWCVRECERAVIFEPNQKVVYKDWTKRQYNIPKENTNADSRSAGTPGGPADA